MVDLNKIKNIYLYASPISLSLGIPSLTNIIETNYTKKEIKDSLFVFFGKSKSQIKIIEIDDTGVWLYQKRLTNSNFQPPSLNQGLVIDKQQLLVILNNIKPKKVRNNAKKY